MGSGRFSARAYATWSASSTAGRTTEEIYTSRAIDPYLNPFGVKVRESRDSADNPLSTPLIVALDVTGSMGILADNIARTGLGTLFTGVLDRKPITDPHVMFMGIGDVKFDQAPLQVSQFEADNRIVDQLVKLWLEHGGGGNACESYDLAWYFAALHTVHDAYEKRGKRGYLFTVGDEEPPDGLTPTEIRHFIGDTPESAYWPEQSLEMAQRVYDVFHVIIEEGSHARSRPDAVRDRWRMVLGQRVISLADHTKLAETIVSAIEVAEGRDATDSAMKWGAGSTLIYEAVKNLPKSITPRIAP
jgi:hypothetical protein